MPRSSEVKSVLLVLVLTLGRGARCKRRGAVFLPPDSTGLVGTPPADRPLLPLKFWANPRKSPLKPRRKDLDEPTLLKLMGQDFDPRWMRRTHPSHTHAQDASASDTQDRATVRTLREMAREKLQLPDELLPPEYRAAVTAWLVQRATCPIRYIWDDLGPYFWPRWVRRGECVHDAGVETKSEGRNSSRSTDTRNVPCSWPPGMLCVPGVARNLQILRWHCRLRKNLIGSGANSNNVWLLRGTVGQAVVDKHHNSSSKSKRRKRYRCQWLKVPYPVPEDCVCSC